MLCFNQESLNRISVARSNDGRRVGIIYIDSGRFEFFELRHGLVLTQEELREINDTINDVCGTKDPLDLAAETIHHLNFLGGKNAGVPDIMRIICGVCGVDREEAGRHWESVISHRVRHLQQRETERHIQAVNLYRNLQDVPDAVRNSEPANGSSTESPAMLAIV